MRDIENNIYDIIMSYNGQRATDRLPPRSALAKTRSSTNSLCLHSCSAAAATSRPNQHQHNYQHQHQHCCSSAKAWLLYLRWQCLDGALLKFCNIYVIIGTQKSGDKSDWICELGK